MSELSLPGIAGILRAGDVDRALSELNGFLPRTGDQGPLAYLKGVAYLQKHDGEAALEQLLIARDSDPGDPDVHYHLALAYLQTRGVETDDALQCLQLAVQIDPAHFAAGYELGRVYRLRGDADRALACFVGIANSAAHDERIRDAILALNEALSLAPNSGELLVFLGRMLLAEGRFEHARVAFEKALALNPGNADVLNELGVANFRLGDIDEAEKCYAKALSARTVFPQARNNLGNVYAACGHSKKAIKQYGFAIAQMPNYSDALFNVSKEYLHLGDISAAREACERAIAASPDHALAHVHLADILLAEGEFERGWREYEWRVAADSGRDYLLDPADQNKCLPRPSTLELSALAGRRMLVDAEATLGDELVFLRFLPALIRHGIDVAYRPSAKLRPLLEDKLDHHDFTLAPSAPASSDYDFMIAAGDLPLLVRHAQNDAIPAPYVLTPNETALAEMASVLEALEEGPILGITWRAGFASDGLRRKEIKLEDVAELIEDWPGPVLAMQRELAAAELEQLKMLSHHEIHDFGEISGDLWTCAPLLHLLDEYVGVSNTNMHLMACLGHPSRVLVTGSSEWRWQTQGRATPWAPQAKIYRAESNSDLTAALKACRDDLRARHS